MGAGHRPRSSASRRDRAVDAHRRHARGRKRGLAHLSAGVVAGAGSGDDRRAAAGRSALAGRRGTGAVGERQAGRAACGGRLRDHRACCRCCRPACSLPGSTGSTRRWSPASRSAAGWHGSAPAGSSRSRPICARSARSACRRAWSFGRRRQLGPGRRRARAGRADGAPFEAAAEARPVAAEQRRFLAGTR